MKNQKGFTLVELLVVVAILGVILLIAVPNLNSSSNSTRNKVYDTKVTIIEDAAILYGQDNYRSIVSGSQKDKDADESTENVIYKIRTITVLDLIPDYVDPDNEGTENLVNDPRETGKYLDKYKITIKINPNTKKVTAKMQEENE